MSQNEYSLENAAPGRKVDREFTLEAVKRFKKMRIVVAGATTGIFVIAKARGR